LKGEFRSPNSALKTLTGSFISERFDDGES
jgi:hypothetical protein